MLGSGSLPALNSRGFLRRVWLGLDIQFHAKGYPLSVIQHFKLYEFIGLNFSVDDDTT